MPGVIICLWFLLLPVLAYTQQAEDISQEALSYAYYLNAQWKPLLKLHKDMHAEGKDYYYLRIRSAYALQALGKPISALSALNKANTFWRNPEDHGLYQSLLYASHSPEEAELYAGSAGIRPVVRLVGWESGLLSASGATHANNLMQNYNVYGEHNRLKQLQYHAFQIQHRLMKGVHLEHDITAMGIDRSWAFAWRNGGAVDFPNTVQQIQYYLSAHVARKQGWMLKPAFHAIHVSYKSIIASPDLTGLNYQFTQSSQNQWQYIASAEISKRLQHFKPSISTAYSTINRKTQWISYAGVSWFPMGDMRYYLHAGSTLFIENTTALLIPKVIAGITLHKIWLAEAGFTMGTMYNYHENNAQLIFNVPDRITHKGFAGITCFAKPRWNMGLMYSVQQRQANQLYYSPAAGGTPEPNYNIDTYTLQGISLTFKYTFQAHSL
jgi:hypothetical protein